MFSKISYSCLAILIKKNYLLRTLSCCYVVLIFKTQCLQGEIQWTNLGAEESNRGHQ